MKFLVPNYSCLQNHWLGATAPRPRSLCPLSSTEFVEPPPPKKFLGTPLCRVPSTQTCTKLRSNLCMIRDNLITNCKYFTTFRWVIPFVFYRIDIIYIYIYIYIYKIGSQNTTKFIALYCTICYTTTCFGPFF